MALRDLTWFSEYTGINRGTAYSMVHRKQVPHVRIGKRLVRFDEQEIEQWLAARRVAVKPTEAR